MNIDNLGTCPICGRGKIIDGTNKYMCVNIADNSNVNLTVQDVCTFSFYKSYFDHTLTPEEIHKLLTDGETDEIDLKRKDGTAFTAKLVFDKKNKVIKPLFPEKQFENLDEKCPVCGGNMLCTTNYFMCENAIGDEKNCFFIIKKIIAKKELAKKIVENLITQKKTDFIDGFKNSQNESFSSRLILDINTDEQKVNVTFNSDICVCPKCGSGVITSGKTAYGCTNYKNENIKCNFTIWKEINGRTITVKDVLSLCEKGQTEILSGFKTKDGKKYNGKLVCVDDFKVKII